MIKLYGKDAPALMTSEERKQKRYERRKRDREQKAEAVCGKAFEDVYSFENTWDAGENSCSGVRWKTSTINFESMLLTQSDSLQESVLDGTYRFNGFKHFKTIEHGKERDINSLVIQDRTVQKCYCDEIMTEAYSRSFIYDNSASLPGKGMDKTLERLEMFLHEHYRKYGLEGGIFQFDFHGYFASLLHSVSKERLRKHIHDPHLQALGCQFIDDYASPIDHYVKDVRSIRGYARYMDDGYIISNSLEELEDIKKAIFQIAADLGLEMNEKKCIITPFKNHSFKFLKMRVRLEPTGKVVIKLSRNSIKAIRRKLKIFREWVDTGKMGVEDVFASYQSWRSHAARCDSYKTVHAMDLYFVSLLKKSWQNGIKSSNVLWTQNGTMKSVGSILPLQKSMRPKWKNSIAQERKDIWMVLYHWQIDGITV